jgi:hypothetical protein
MIEKRLVKINSEHLQNRIIFKEPIKVNNMKNKLSIIDFNQQNIHYTDL